MFDGRLYQMVVPPPLSKIMKLSLFPQISILCFTITSLGMSAASAATATWDGGGIDDDWTTALNWGGAAPAASDRLIFTGTTRITPNNSFAADTSFNRIRLNNTLNGESFTLSGNSIILAGGGIAVANTAVSGTDFITDTIDLAKITFSVANTNIDTGTGRTLIINSALSGTKRIDFNDSLDDGKIILNGDNSGHSGGMVIKGGVVEVNQSNALGTGLVTLEMGVENYF